MRLIDADEIHYCEYDLDNYHWFRAVDEDEIAEMPTIDAVPVVHGYWKPMKAYKTECVCSECGELWPDWKSPYCPDCGAKMDGERKE